MFEPLPMLDIPQIVPPSAPNSNRPRKNGSNFPDSDGVTLKRRNIRELHRNAEFEDPLALAKQKYEVVKEIRAIKKQNSQLQAQLIDFQQKYDQEAETQIYFAKFHEEDPSVGENQARVFEKTKELREAQEEVEQLEQQLTFLNSYFSDDNETKLRTDIGFQHHTMGLLQEQLVAYMALSESAYGELQSQGVTEGLQTVRSLNTEYNQLAQELTVKRRENGNVKHSVDTFRRGPVNNSLQEEVDTLSRKYRALKHREEQRRKELSEVQHKYETQKVVIDQIRYEKQQQEYNAYLASQRQKTSSTRSTQRTGNHTPSLTEKQENITSTLLGHENDHEEPTQKYESDDFEPTETDVQKPEEHAEEEKPEVPNLKHETEDFVEEEKKTDPNETEDFVEKKKETIPSASLNDTNDFESDGGEQKDFNDFESTADESALRPVAENAKNVEKAENQESENPPDMGDSNLFEMTENTQAIDDGLNPEEPPASNLGDFEDDI